jgi:hypothetical protein
MVSLGEGGAVAVKVIDLGLAKSRSQVESPCQAPCTRTNVDIIGVRGVIPTTSAHPLRRVYLVRPQLLHILGRTSGGRELPVAARASIAVNALTSSVNLMRVFQIPEGTIKDCLLRVPRRRLARMPDLLRLEESFPERLHT